MVLNSNESNLLDADKNYVRNFFCVSFLFLKWNPFFCIKKNYLTIRLQQA